MSNSSASEQFDPFWKSQSLDSINQLLQESCTSSMNVAITPLSSEIKYASEAKYSPEIKYASEGKSDPNANPPISLSAQSTLNPILPPFPPSLNSSIASSINPALLAHYPVTQASQRSQGQATEATTSSPPSTSQSMPSMLASFQSSQLVPLAAGSQSRELIKVEKEPTYVDVTPFLILPQHEAARRLGVPCSTLSKRWKEASVNRKWPYRIVCKLDKEITTLLKNVENSNHNVAALSPAVEENLGLLLKRRQEELRTVVIRIN